MFCSCGVNTGTRKSCPMCGMPTHNPMNETKYEGACKYCDGKTKNINRICDTCKEKRWRG